jgi:hypothetical protein
MSAFYSKGSDSGNSGASIFRGRSRNEPRELSTCHDILPKKPAVSLFRQKPYPAVTRRCTCSATDLSTWNNYTCTALIHTASGSCKVQQAGHTQRELQMAGTMQRIKISSNDKHRGGLMSCRKLQTRNPQPRLYTRNEPPKFLSSCLSRTSFNLWIRQPAQQLQMRAEQIPANPAVSDKDTIDKLTSDCSKVSTAGGPGAHFKS